MLESLQFMQKITSDNNLSREEESLIFIFHINILKRFLANAVVSKTNQCTTIFGTKSTTTDEYWYLRLSRQHKNQTIILESIVANDEKTVCMIYVVDQT